MRKYLLNHGEQLASHPKVIEVEPSRTAEQPSLATI
jgi:hypothetical protein